MNKYALAFAQALDAKQARNAEVAQRLRVDPSYVSQWKLGRRPIPPDKAISVAAMLQVAPEEISEAHERMLQAGFAPENTLAWPAPAGDDPVPEGHLSLAPLDGFGRLPEGPRRLVLPEFLVRQKVGLVPVEHVRWALHPSKAMEPAIALGALVLIDVRANGHDAVVDGLTYAYRLRERPDMRRILLRKDHWIVAGADSHSDRQSVSINDLDQLTICGQVLSTC